MAVEHLGGVGVGVTRAQFFRADDGKIYVVKLQNNRLGAKVLVSEYLAARVGEILGLCFPPGGIIEIGEDLLAANPALIEAGACAGRHFASQYLDNALYAGRDNLGKAANVAEMAGVVLFDHIFLNADRGANRKNLLLRRENGAYRIYAIDNSHLFRSGKWTAESLQKQISRIKIYYQRSYGVLLKQFLGPDDFRPYVEKVKNIGDERIEELIGEIPVEWLPEQTDRQILARFVKKRRDLAEYIWQRLCNHIPVERGGRRREFHRIIRLTGKNRTGLPVPQRSRG